MLRPPFTAAFGSLLAGKPSPMMLDPAIPATRDQLFKRLAALGIKVQTVSHPPLHSVAEAQTARQTISGLSAEGHCKNLFLKDKKGALYLIVVLETQNVPIQALARRIGAARLSFGKPELLLETLGVTPGSVTPLGLINDPATKVKVVLDRALLDHDLVSCHPLSNDATTALKPADLCHFIQACGHEPIILDFEGL